MRILHLRNIAGVGATLAREQRAMGHDAVCVQLLDKGELAPPDISLDLPARHSPFEIPARAARVLAALARLGRFDVFHLHDGGILPADTDIPLFELAGARVFVHWHGSKLRSSSLPGWRADGTFVSTPDLLDFAPDATWLPLPVDLARIDGIAPAPATGTLTIAHAPTNRALKGTSEVISAVEQLRRKGFDVELRIVEGLPHGEVLSILGGSDIVVDQVNPQIGTYGMVSIEAMAMSRPVVCTIAERHRRHFPGCPVVSPGEGGLAGALEGLLADGEMRSRLGAEGRAYVERMHESRSLASRLTSLYTEP